MIAFRFTSGSMIHLNEVNACIEDPAGTIISLDCDKRISFGTFVYDAALRWKTGDTALFHDLLTILLRFILNEISGDLLCRNDCAESQVKDMVRPEELNDKVDEHCNADSDSDQDRREDSVKTEPAVKFENLEDAFAAPSTETDKPSKTKKLQLQSCIRESVLPILGNRKWCTCTECDFKTKIRSELKRHLHLVHSVRMTPRKTISSSTLCSCEICEKHFTTLEDLQQHVERLHRDKAATSPVDPTSHSETDPTRSLHQQESRQKRLQCQRCQLTFCSLNSLKTHVRIVHDNIRDFQCSVCETRFATVSGVKRHIVTHHDLEPDEENFQRLNTASEASRIICQQCNQDVSSSDELVTHVLAVHPTMPHLFPSRVRSHGPLPWSRSEAWERGSWTCPICPAEMLFRADTLNGMVSHVKLGHPDSIICWVCGTAWSSQQGQDVYKHMLESHPLKALFACNQCGVYNASKKLLTNHKKIHRMEEISGPLNSCDMCDYVTPRPDLMAKHRFSHRASKNYMCNDCGKVLGSRTALATHARLHTSQEDRRHECQLCYKVFTQRGYLKTHMNTHSDIRPYSCEFCAMTFIGPTNLSQHRKRAHGDMIGECPKLSCSLCSKRFWIPSELKYHVERVHEGKKEFSCPECLKRFADKKNLKKHSANVHKTRVLSFAK